MKGSTTMPHARVIVRGLGNVGRAAIRMIAEKKSLELVGAIDVDPAKVGRDAGEVFGFAPVGVVVSDDVDAVLSQDADVVLDYTPLLRDEKGGFTPSAVELCRGLRAGKNVITTQPLYYSHVTTPELFTLLDTAAKENGVTFLPSGLLPGAYASYLPLVSAGLMGHVDSIRVVSGEDDQLNTSSWLQVFGYGADPATFPAERLKAGIVSYYVSGVYELGDRLGVTFDEMRTSHEVFTAPQDLHPAWGTVPKGTIYGHRFVMSGIVDGEPKATLEYVHRICADAVEEPRIDDLIHIEGVPSALDVRVTGLMPLDESYVTSAAPTVNVIHSVVAAEPGYRQAMDLPVVVPIV